MLPGRAYLVKIGATTLGATLGQPKYKVNVNTLEHLAAKHAGAQRDRRLQPDARSRDRVRCRTRRTATWAASS